jgi:DNA-directed RNA polymerase specialized sigma24 family protein
MSAVADGGGKWRQRTKATNCRSERRLRTAATSGPGEPVSWGKQALERQQGMAPSESVTAWIRGIETGDPAAAEALWGRYFEKLVRIAERKLRGRPRRVADEEDVALSAFHSFCRAAREGRFPHLSDRYDLWRLLLEITAHKAVDLIRYGACKKRHVLGESAMARPGKGAGEDQGAGLDEVIGKSPSPEFAAEVADQCRHLLEMLGDRELQTLAMAKMQGRSNDEIARELCCSVRTVERRLHLIRKKWEAAAAET